MSRGDDDGFGCEAAPFQTDSDNILTHYYPPISVRAGRRINWYRDLLVIHHHKRFPAIEVVNEPKFSYSNFVHGYDMLPVRVPG
jgi:hypothetical protein